jgi:hypothetical protein
MCLQRGLPSLCEATGVASLQSSVALSLDVGGDGRSRASRLPPAGAASAPCRAAEPCLATSLGRERGSREGRGGREGADEAATWSREEGGRKGFPLGRRGSS